MLMTCLNLSLLPYPIVCWKSSQFWLKEELQTPNCQAADADVILQMKNKQINTES